MAFMQHWLTRLDTLLQAPQALAQNAVPIAPIIDTNPTTGLPMVGDPAGMDVGGTPYGMLPCDTFTSSWSDGGWNDMGF